MSDEQPRIAVCPGSYDPVTNGHLDVIGRAARVFDTVVVGVVNNPVRKQQTLFTAEERKKFIEEATAEFGNVEVGIMSNLLVEFAKEKGASAVVKGLRAISAIWFPHRLQKRLRNGSPAEAGVRKRWAGACNPAQKPNPGPVPGPYA